MSISPQINVVSYLAPNWFWVYEAIAACIARQLHVRTEIWQSQSDPLDDSALQHDQVDLAFICGLPFIRLWRQQPASLQAIAAPVMQETRYQNCPVYFSDVIVNAASPLTVFVDLADKTFCYNDLGSNSGYNLMRYRLMQGSYPNSFFGKTMPSGSHQHSIQQVVAGNADCAAIDSVVLERELQAHPELRSQIRVVDSIGPCPMPPIVAAQHLQRELIEQIRSVLLEPDAVLQQVMYRAGIRRFASVKSDHYNAIAAIYDTALEAGYEVIGATE